MQQDKTLSILIPSRNEEWLNRTVEDILENSTEATDVIVVLDGDVPKDLPPIHPRLTVVMLPKSIGQRAATNLAAKLSKAHFVAKTDGHCAFDKEFDRILLEDAKDNQVVVPAMRNLHIFDWVCEKGHRRYQGPSGPCLGTYDAKKKKHRGCGLPTQKDVKWFAKPSPRSRSYCFDPEPHFQYFGGWLKRRRNNPEITETMSLQGSFFMLTRKKYWELKINDETQFKSWGSQGIEVAVKAWCSGMQVVCNNKTWYAHLFRTQGGDFTFPYPIKHSETMKNRAKAREYFLEAKWRKQVYPVSWLLEKFWPIETRWSSVDYWKQKALEIQKIERSGIFSIEHRPSGKYFVFAADNIKRAAALTEKALQAGQCPNTELQQLWSNKPSNEFWWHVEIFCREATLPKMYERYSKLAAEGKLKHPRIEIEPPLTKGILYYTDGNVPADIDRNVKQNLNKAGLPITAVGLKPVEFGDRRIMLEEKRGALAMSKQILAGLEAMTEDIVFMAEHDVLYPPRHFEFTPERKDRYYYNTNVWKLNPERRYGLKVDDCRQLSGMCAYRETLIPHYRERVRRLAAGESATKMGYEPGTHNRKERVDKLRSETWKSPEPIVDIRHGSNLTKTKWAKEEFRNQKYTEGWQEDSVIPSWGPADKLVKALGLG